MARMRAILVTHTHWDREWYRTFQGFRARLVDAVDRVLDLCAADPGYRFLLDGQTAVLEDYLAVRPDREGELRARCAEGRLAIGPWYVQPDSLLPSGEAHVRNLLLGRSVGEAHGPVSRVGYTPDSFGHPAQLPQLLAGFGLRAFVYWRGHGGEIDDLPAEYDWEAPDGSTVLACHLGKGYFNAATPPDADLEEAARGIAARAKDLAARTRSGAILLLNGVDHAGPEPRTAELASEVARASGFDVERGLVEDFVDAVEASGVARPRHRGELVGARVAPLLPGVWSTRTWIKQANRRAEAALEGWAEPWAALGARFGLADERPALRAAWQALLQNQAHDSLCGCSRDAVHEQMRARFDAAEELARETTGRCLERLAGLGPARIPPFAEAFDLLVANPSPRPRSDVVRFRLDFHPYAVPHPDPRRAIHPFVLHDVGRSGGFTVDGAPARLVPAEEDGRLVLIPGRAAFDVEFLARDVPALGFRRVRLARVDGADAAAERERRVAPGRRKARIAAGDVGVSVREDGCFDVDFGGARFEGLGAFEDVGDRGDTYDFDPVEVGRGAKLASVRAWRRRHPSGIEHLTVERVLRVPEALAPGRRARSRRRVALRTWTELRVVPGVRRVDVRVRVDNAARDHRLRLLFPVGARVAACDAATTFDVVHRAPGPRPDAGWVQRAPATFPQQGFVHAGGLSVAAPGLPEAELLERDGASAIALTLLRCVGDLSRHDLDTRPGLAGPGTATPGAQCLGPFEARLALLPGLDPAAAREVELGLAAVACGDAPLAPEGVPLVALGPADLLLSALKPAESGAGLVARVLNPTDAPATARLALGVPFAEARLVRLDEEPAEGDVTREGDALVFAVPPHALRSVRIA
jgi:mannosylglycerate hydrolase